VFSGLIRRKYNIFYSILKALDETAALIFTFAAFIPCCFIMLILFFLPSFFQNFSREDTKK